MRLTCLVVVRSSNLLNVLKGALIQARIEAKVCATADDALAHLHAHKFDAVIVDCVEFEQGFEVLHSIRKTPPNRRSVVFAIVDEETSHHDRAQTGASFVLERPIHPDILARSIRAAQSLMVAEHRRYFRYRAPMKGSIKRGSSEFRVDVTNISSGGMAVHLDRTMEPGWVGSVELVVPETHLAVHAKVELVWINSDLTAGFRFVNIADQTRDSLDEWLNQKCKEEEIAMPVQ